MSPYNTQRLDRKPAAVAHSYNVDVSPTDEGKFRARAREVPIEITSANAEHDIAHLLTKAGYRDGSIQFWRGKTKSLSHSSIRTMAKYRVALGEDFPARVKRRVFTPDRLEGALAVVSEARS